MSFSFLLRINTSGASRVFLDTSLDASSDDAKGFMIFTYQSEDLVFAAGDGTWGQVQFDSSANCVLDVWARYIFTIDASKNYIIYKDGLPKDSGVFVRGIDFDDDIDDLYIGLRGDNWPNDDSFDMDEVIFWNRVVSPAEAWIN